jgi:hypothetical protein
MKTRMARGIATVAVFGALAISAMGGHGTVGATSPDVTAQPITASAVATDKIQGASHTLFTVTGSASNSTSDTNRIAVVAVAAPVAGHLPLTKGGRFP